MNDIIIRNIKEIEALCDAHHVKNLFAFGSVCTDNFNDLSDVDLLVTFDKMNYGDYADTYFILVNKFEKLFHRPVDLVTEKSLSNPYFIKSVDQTKVRIYG